jgi:predicted dehydrogenase
MYKIGIIGSENSHCMSFAKALNLPDACGAYRYPDVRVVKIMGDAESAEKTRAEANVPEIAQKIEEFFDCDAVMVTARRGSQHLALSLPFLQKGIPTFIDKPFTVSEAEAETLLAAAQKSGALVCGGSACKFAPKVLELKERVAVLRREKRLAAATLSFNLFIDIEYDGFFFYASHLIEMCTAIFGDGIESVVAERNGASVAVLARYADVVVTLLYTGGVFESAAVLYTKQGIVFENIDVSSIFDEELKVFVNMLKTKTQPAPLRSYLLPVVLMNAVHSAYSTGKPVTIRL